MTDLSKIVRTPQGMPVMAPSFVYVEQSGLIKGHRFVCQPDSTNHFDWQLAYSVALQGVLAIIVGNHDGDYGEFSVVDKDDVLGLFALYGLTVGVDVLMIQKFGETVYVPEGRSDISFMFDSAFQIPAGLYLRMTWECNHATEAPTIYPAYKLYRD
jgi:hypothetical protein